MGKVDKHVHIVICDFVLNSTVTNLAIVRISEAVLQIYCRVGTSVKRSSQSLTN
jgi:hypothetical protein